VLLCGACCGLVRRGFKALKQIVKLLFKLGRREEMMEAYRCVFGGGVSRGRRVRGGQ
jgi:hypothetical protein